jgi:hypothetical protein
LLFTMKPLRRWILSTHLKGSNCKRKGENSRSFLN